MDCEGGKALFSCLCIYKLKIKIHNLFLKITFDTAVEMLTDLSIESYRSFYEIRQIAPVSKSQAYPVVYFKEIIAMGPFYK